MYLIQLLLPVYDPAGQPFPRTLYDAVVLDLTQRFGGLTAYTRAPATGLWEHQSGTTVRDDVVVYEVMVPDVDPDWWARLRVRLEREFRQQEIVVRAQKIRRL